MLTDIHEFMVETIDYFDLLNTIHDIREQRLESSGQCPDATLYNIALFGFACNAVKMYSQIDEACYNYHTVKAYTDYLELLLEKGELI